MTPTLVGRWQTRALLLGTTGLLLSLGFGRLFGDLVTPLVLLGYVLVFGFAWDALYQYLQSFRWDRDWPPVFQFAAGIVEAAFIWALVRLIGLPGVSPELTLGQFFAHYATVWFVAFVGTQGPLRLIFPRWRYRGGRWL